MARMRKTVVSRAAVHGGPRVFTMQHLGDHSGVAILPEPHSCSPVATQRVHVSGGKEGFTPWHKHTVLWEASVSASPGHS